MSASCSDQRRPAPPSALRHADPTGPLCVRVLDSTGEYPQPDVGIPLAGPHASGIHTPGVGQPASPEKRELRDDLPLKF